MVEKSRPAYPRLSAKAWWKIRQRFQQSVPSAVTAGYLAGLFDCSEASASSNYLRPLKLLGLVGEDNKATERAMRWRNDDDYLEVCNEIMEATYPAELRESQPCPEPDKSAVKSWFSRTTGQGNDAVEQMAALYGLLCRASLDDQGIGATRVKAPNVRASGPRTPPTLNKQRVKSVGESVSATGVPAPSREAIAGRETAAERISPAPTLHIDVQIHISPEASAEQIDQIFKSMSTHLYRNESATGR